MSDVTKNTKTYDYANKVSLSNSIKSFAAGVLIQSNALLQPSQVESLLHASTTVILRHASMLFYMLELLANTFDDRSNADAR